MEIYIKDIKMPIFEHQSWDIRKGTDEKWYVIDTNAETSDGVWHKIIPIPPHGRLGDLDELYNHLNEWYLTHEHGFSGNEKIYIRAMLLGVKDAPTIIPADNPKEE